MIEFTEAVNLCTVLQKQAELLLQELITEHSENDEEYDKNISTYTGWKLEPRVVGIEKCGILLFTWQCSECTIAKTFIACYHTRTEMSKMLLFQKKLLTIANASLNCKETLLCFITVENTSKLDGESMRTDQIFSGYIAEIAPQNGVFSLNIECSTYLKIHFLNEYPYAADQNKFYMVFCNHKNNIQLYELQTERSKEQKIVLKLKPQPSTQQIAGSFLWSKFDPDEHLLYYLQLLPQDEQEIEAAAVLTVVEFRSNGTFEYVMNFILPIKFKMEYMRRQSVYNIDQFSWIVSCRTFNLDVLVEAPGSFYVCFQHQVTESKYEEDTSEDDQSVISESSSSFDSILQPSIGSEGNTFVDYTIVSVHGAYTSHCSSILSSVGDAANLRVHFLLYRDYVLALLPGSFLHFLDISCEHEPVHSLLIRTKKFLPCFPEKDSGNVALMPFSASLLNGDTRNLVTLMGARSQTVYSISLDAASMYCYFLSSKPQTRLSILHACMDHLHHPKLTKKVVERICQDPANADSSMMLKEYLVLAPFVEMKKLVSIYDLRMFPFTTQSCYRGQVERNSEGHRDIYLSFKYFKKDLVAQIQKVLRNRQDLFWKNLIKYMTFESEYRNKRVFLKLFYLAAVDNTETLSPSPSKLKAAVANNNKGRRNTSFVIVPRQNASPGITGVDDSAVLEETKHSIDDNALDENHKLNEAINSIATSYLVNYVTRCYGRETKARAQNVCQQYAEVRCGSINQLWKCVLKALGSTDEALRFKKLTSPASELEVAIFQVVERLKVICDQLCYPQLPCMNDLLSTLSFCCLNRRQFIAYLDAEVFQIGINWVRRAIQDLPANDVNASFIHNLVKRLSKVDAQKVLMEWNHPLGNRYLSEFVSGKTPFDAIHGSFNNSINFEVMGNDKFIPLETFLQARKALGKSSNLFGGRHGEKRQTALLRKAALSSTNELLG